MKNINIVQLRLLATRLSFKINDALKHSQVHKSTLVLKYCNYENKSSNGEEMLPSSYYVFFPCNLQKLHKYTLIF